MDVRGERGHDDPSGRVAHDSHERRGHDLLGLRHAGTLGVGRVGHQHVDAVLAEPGETCHVGALAVDRRVVELEVARVHDRAVVGVQRDRDGIRDRVGHPHELGLEGAAGKPLHLVGIDLHEGRARAATRARRACS